ncbi:MAG TPA: hypothetical protein PLA24_06840, partial [Tenuifilaceae bacterium]|nr:hypothetical protein [Tenuifilaceae bacterium]
MKVVKWISTILLTFASTLVFAQPSAPSVTGTTPTNNTKPTWNWTSGGGGNGTFRYKLDDNDLTSGTTETTDLFYTSATDLSEGNHTLYVQETDGTNWSASGSFTITIDLTSPTITAVTIPNSPMKVNDIVTATITVSDDSGDTYTLNSGNINGFSLSGLSRTNSTTYTASFTVTEAGTDIPAGSDIPLSVVLTDGAGNSNTAYTSSISQNNDAIDANSPSITNVTIPNLPMKVNDIVTATITVSDDNGDTYTLNSGNINGFSLSGLSRTNSTTYTASFTVTEAGTDIPAGSDIPLSVVL